jgi:hypothetical protein
MKIVQSSIQTARERERERVPEDWGLRMEDSIVKSVTK